MKKEVFSKLFYIENSSVISIKLLNNDLIIELSTDVLCYAMGNNIRENDYNEVTNCYRFINISDISSDKLFNIKNIYSTSLINSLICFNTDIGIIYFNCDEVIVK